MIDLHSHIIFDVDDGSKNLDQSIKYLKEIKKIGMNKVVCTPHMSHGKKDKALKIVKNFKILREEALKYGITLYLGNEILYKDNTIDLLNHKKLARINNSKYVLIEFKRNETMNIDNIINILDDIIDAGYKPIIAHPELYVNYRNIENMKKIKETGTLLQLDATSILFSKTKFKIYKFSKKLLKDRLIDVVASDSHCTKKRDYLSMIKAYKKIKKIDKQYADIIFNENPLEIVGD